MSPNFHKKLLTCVSTSFPSGTHPAKLRPHRSTSVAVLADTRLYVQLCIPHLAQIIKFPAVAQTSPSPVLTRQATAERQGPHTKQSKALGPALPARERNEEGEGSGGERVTHVCNFRCEPLWSSCPLSVVKKSSATSVPTRWAAIRPAPGLPAVEIK